MTREEAIRRIKAWNLDSDDMEVLSAVVPELRESEDERIRKEIIDYLGLVGKGDGDYAQPMIDRWIAYLEKQKEQNPIIQDVELNDAVYDYVRDHFIAGADFTPEYIKKLMENAFFAGVDYYLLKQESESCEPDTNVEKVIEDVIRVYGKTQGEWVCGYDVDTLIVNLRRAFNKKEQNPAEWSNTDKIGWDEAFACVTRAEKAAKNEEELQNAVTAEKWLKEIKFKYYVHPVKQEWSEEDENKMGVIIRLVEQNSGFPDRAIKEYVAWLKSLKNRGNFLKSNTNSPSWSEEDELNIGWLIAYLKGESAGEYYDEMMRESLADWLKSLRPQPRWKPSEEQMAALEKAIIRVHSDDEIPILCELRQQLKKLM